MAIFAVSISVSIYLYYVNGCPELSMELLGVIIIAVLAAFYVLYLLMRHFEFREERGHKRLLGMLQAHESKISKIIEIEMAYRLKAEKEVAAILEKAREKTKDFAEVEAVLLGIITSRAEGAEADKKQEELSKKIEDALAKEASKDATSEIINARDALSQLLAHYKRQENLQKEFESVKESIYSAQAPKK